MKYLIITALCLLTLNKAKAQLKKEEPKARVEVIAKSFGDSIVLRWAPDQATAWKLGNKYGYMVERYTILKDNKLSPVKPEKISLTAAPLKPVDLKQWKPLADKDDYAAIAAEAIYGQQFELTGKSTDIIKVINAAKELENRYSFALFAADQSLEIAQAHGLKLTDKNVVKGEKYLYKVYLNAPANVLKADTGTVLIGTNEVYPLPRPFDLKADFSDKAVMLSWNSIYHQHIYTGYFIERSDDGGQTFNAINQLPFVNTYPNESSDRTRMFKIDSIPENGKLYMYRIKGRTPFGEIGPVSDTVSGRGEESTLGITPVITKVEVINEAIKIHWKVPEEKAKLIKNVIVARATSNSGQYETISEPLDVKRKEYLDSRPESTNYYVVKAVDAKGKHYPSFPYLAQLPDSIPPLPPSGLEGKIGDQGDLIIKWKHNKENDLLGYRVYMAHNKDDEFTQITVNPVTDSVYFDTITLEALNKKIYFKLMALDNRYNFSKFSEVLELKRPDIYPPVSPIIEFYNITDSSVILKWRSSTSMDVVKHRVYKRKRQEKDWQLLLELDSLKDKGQLEDKELSAGEIYQYLITALDDSGLESPKDKVIEVQLPDRKIKPEIKEVTYHVDRQKREIVLLWNYQEPGVEKFLIYKAEKGNPIRLYKSVGKGQASFIDKTLSINSLYTYRIKAVFEDGSQSILSKELEVNY
ncbi:MAG TPA: hypothetical protein VIK89_00565 [Cytophagaceae bacterium]